jgi:3-oxoacyl-[acyl-carrier-protein] synthase-3
LAAVATYEPALQLANDWFGGTISRKFAHHTGTHSRRISTQDEVAMALAATANLQAESRCDLQDCAGVIFVSPSFIPATITDRYAAHAGVERERLQRAAGSFVRRLGISPRLMVGINWFCSGYAKALWLAQRVAAAVSLQQSQFILIVTAGRISRITDFSCSTTAPLFGDLATATLLARVDSTRYPVHFKLLSAFAAKEPAPSPFFDFDLREDVLMPAEDGSQSRSRQRLVFSLDGLGIADVAPRAMARAVTRALTASQIPVDQVQHVVPHQAGTGIVRLTGMKLDQLGIRAEVVNGVTSEVGNVSSSSIPYALKQTWGRLGGIIACPTAAVGSPGKAEVSSGCVLLEAPASAVRMKKIA